MTLKMDIKTFTVTDNTIMEHDSAYSSDTNDSHCTKPQLKNYIDTFRNHNTDIDITSRVISLEQQILSYKQEINKLQIY